MKLRWRGQVTRRAEGAGLVAGPCDAVLVVRSRPRLLLLGCPCGCGDEIVVNVDAQLEGTWRLYRDPSGVSLYPSVWRDDACRSHFILWSDKIILFAKRERLSWGQKRDRELRRRVVEFLRWNGPTAYVAIADALAAVPWDVFDELSVLERAGTVSQWPENSGVFDICSGEE